MDTMEVAMAELESYAYEIGEELVPRLWENIQQFNRTEIVENFWLCFLHMLDIKQRHAYS